MSQTSFFDRPPVTLYLVRHGQSEANVDRSLYRRAADHTIPLTALGQDQAREAGQYLNGILHGMESFVLRSPYTRTRQTEAMVTAQIDPALIRERVELPEMIEQEMGIFNGIPDEELETTFPAEFARYRISQSQKGLFWARPPQGDSPFDVYKRAIAVVSAIGKAHSRTGIGSFVIVSHGVFQRCLLMAWRRLPYEWYSESTLPENCSVTKVTANEPEEKVFVPTVATTENLHAH